MKLFKALGFLSLVLFSLGASAQTGDYRYVYFQNLTDSTVTVAIQGWRGSYWPQFQTLRVAPGERVNGRIHRYHYTAYLRFTATIPETGQRCEFDITYSPSNQSAQGVPTGGDPLPTCTTNVYGRSIFFYMDVPSDTDNDGIPDADDNCPDIANPDQADADGDGIGNACDVDDMRSMFFYNNSAYPIEISDVSWSGSSYSPQFQTLTVQPGESVNGGMLRVLYTAQFSFKATVQGTNQNCEFYLTYTETDQTVQGITTGEEPYAVCSTDTLDNDVYFYMNVPGLPDADGDGVPNHEDNCPEVVNPDQTDTDTDGQGDACDADIDGDGILNADDNCPFEPNPQQEDTDGDGIGDACDDDIDNDGVVNENDNCLYIANADQEDSDGDGLGNACDDDMDGDGVANEIDPCPLSANPTTISVNGCDSGVANIVNDGCTLADQIKDCNDASYETWQFVNCVGDLLEGYVAAGTLSIADQDAILACANQWGVPNPEDDVYQTDWSTTLTVAPAGILDNDRDPQGDTLSAYLYEAPERGHLTLNHDGSFTYIPEPGWEGTQTFIYKAWDGVQYGLATVTIHVGAGNAAPVAGDDTYTVAPGTRLSLDAPGVLANDSDPEGEPLAAYLVTPPPVGQLFFHQDGSFNYDAPADYQGSVTFIYNAGDGLYKTRATVTLNIQ